MSDNQVQKMLSVLEENIKTAARDNNSNISELATEIGMTKTGFYKMLENGSIKVATLIRISEALNVTCGELLGEKTGDFERRFLSMVKDAVKTVNK